MFEPSRDRDEFLDEVVEDPPVVADALGEALGNGADPCCGTRSTNDLVEWQSLDQQCGTAHCGRSFVQDVIGTHQRCAERIGCQRRAIARTTRWCGSPVTSSTNPSPRTTNPCRV